MPNVFSLVPDDLRELEVEIRRDVEDPESDLLGTLSVTFNPRRVSGATLVAVGNLGRGATASRLTDAASQLIAGSVTTWDLTETVPITDAEGRPTFDGNGLPAVTERMVPLTADRIAEQPLQVVVAVMNAILQGLNPKAAGRSGKTSRTNPPASTSASSKG